MQGTACRTAKPASAGAGRSASREWGRKTCGWNELPLAIALLLFWVQLDGEETAAFIMGGTGSAPGGARGSATGGGGGGGGGGSGMGKRAEA
eukprot:SAG22_NODE_125_length_18883_cov_12.351629_18_plen_92_part_00